MTFRFIHTADIHLDSPLRSLTLRNSDAAMIVANATRQSFVRTVDLCLEKKVDAFLIAGDLYDGKLHSMKTAAFFTSEMRRLTEANIKIFLVRGNHDAESQITKQLVLPGGVHVFSKTGEAVPIEGSNVVVHGMSFAKPHVPHSLLPSYQEPTDGALNIGLLHTSLAGSREHDDYAPCSLQGLMDQGYDYWALGHIHKRKIYADAPQAVVMPGIPQGRHINEAGPKSVTYVEIDSNRDIKIEEHCTAVVQFARIDLDITGLDDWPGLVERAETTLGRAFDDTTTEDHLIARVRLFGATPLAARVRRDADVLIEEFRQAGRRSGSTFVESIVNETTVVTLETKSETSNPIPELRRLMLGKELRSTVGVQTKALLEDLQRKLPLKLRDQFEVGSEQDNSLIEGYLREGAEEMLAWLDVAEESD